MERDSLTVYIVITALVSCVDCLLPTNAAFHSAFEHRRPSTSNYRPSKFDYLYKNRTYNSSEFIKQFVIPRELIHRKNFNDIKFKDPPCSTFSYPFLSFQVDYLKHVVVGASSINQKTDGCWGYIFQLHDKKGKLLKQKYYGFNGTVMHTLKLNWNLTYGDIYYVTFLGVPYNAKKLYSTLNEMPANYCEAVTLMHVKKFYLTNKDVSTDINCTTNKPNIFLEMAKWYCKRDVSIARKKASELDKLFREELHINQCNLNKNLHPTRYNSRSGVDKALSTYLTVCSVAAVVVLMVAAICYQHSKKKRKLEWYKKQNENFKKEMLDKTISIIILHQPGCKELEEVVKAIRAMLCTLNIYVEVPLLTRGHFFSELQHIHDSDIENSTYVVIVFPPSSGGQVLIKQREFIYSLKSIENKIITCKETYKKYIPIYFEDFQTTFLTKSIPPYLIDVNCGFHGFQLPKELKNLLVYMKHEKVQLEKEENFRRLFDAIKTQIENVMTTNHDRCQQRSCERGVITDNRNSDCFMSEASTQDYNAMDTLMIWDVSDENDDDIFCNKFSVS